MECIFCGPVNEYVNLANSFSQDLSETLLVGVRALFLSLAGVWVTITGLKLIVGAIDSRKIAHEFIYLIIAAGLLNAQGADMANTIYRASLSTMAGAAAMVLTTGALATKTDIAGNTATPPDAPRSQIAGLEGMTMLISTAEQSMRVMLTAAGVMWEHGKFGWIAAPLIILPYGLHLIIFSSQIVISIFRILLISLFSPLMMMAVGFGFMRSLMTSGLRTLLASMLILFASTAALALCMYGVASLNMGDALVDGSVKAMIAADNPRLWVVIIMGWVGLVLQGEAVAIASALAQSSLTGQTAAALTGATLLPVWGALKGTVWGGKMAAKGAKWAAGKNIDAMGQMANTMAGDGGGGGKSALRERMNNPGIDVR
ncbi:hypothetical protein [Novispirillum itersonii]|uniref:Type IV secretion system protein TrbL n=1 Tax=Novispirillum itersonii TaxID=189 RepID=A0A7W9ZG78_NOVIT|nr:hypothetical protein [Novispirillum itersonii]MBB6210635.1 type IV secretion system protein TrbL [Novispirillum itersonii]